MKQNRSNRNLTRFVEVLSSNEISLLPIISGRAYLLIEAVEENCKPLGPYLVTSLSVKKSFFGLIFISENEEARDDVLKRNDQIQSA